MERYRRQVISIDVCCDDGVESLYALCDDGTIWSGFHDRGNGYFWHEIDTEIIRTTETKKNKEDEEYFRKMKGSK